MQHATPSGTRIYFERLKTQKVASAHGPLGATDLLVSKLGFGGYRIHEFDPDHRHALERALLGGVNLIDTSSNYTDGSSERVIGEVTSDLFARGALKRDELVFVTKAGYVQGSNLKRVKSAGGAAGYPDMVEYQTDCWHNISPQYLEDQLSRSLERLKLEQVDVFLLHNPEYYLKTSANREQYYARIEKAFRYLETERTRGRIRYYGVSSNTFPEPEAKTEFTSLSRLLEIASKIDKNHHFAVIQLPFNLYEAGAALIQNNKGLTTFELAAREKIGVLTNRPFNSIEKGRLVRLTSFPQHDAIEIKGRLHTALGRAVELEKKAPPSGTGATAQRAAGLTWAHMLRDKINEIDDLLSWKDALATQILPSIRSALSRVPAGSDPWRNEYQVAIQELLDLVTADLESHQNQKTQILVDQITAIAPELASSGTLSRMMTRLYRSFPQISSVLTGMRTPAYVQDLITSPEAPIKVELALELVSRMQRHRL